MSRREVISSKRILVQSSIVISAFGFFEKISKNPDLTDAIKQIIHDAGISWENIKVITLAQDFSSSISLAEFFDQTDCEVNVLMPGNLVGAIVSVKRALSCEVDYNFGLAIYTKSESTFGPLAVGLVVLKKTDYFDNTKWLPESILCSITNASCDIDIVQATIRKANQDLIRYREPAIFQPNAICTVNQVNTLAVLEDFFTELNQKDHLVMLVWLHNHFAQSSILIHT